MRGLGGAEWVLLFSCWWMNTESEGRKKERGRSWPARAQSAAEGGWHGQASEQGESSIALNIVYGLLLPARFTLASSIHPAFRPFIHRGLLPNH